MGPPALVIGPWRWPSPELARHQAGVGLDLVSAAKAPGIINRGDEGDGDGADVGDGAQALDARIAHADLCDHVIRIVVAHL